MCLRVVSGELNGNFHVIVRGITITKLYKLFQLCFVTIPDEENVVDVS